MPIVRKLQAIGGSRALIIPRAFLDQLGLDNNSEVEVSLEGDHIVIVPHRPTKAARVKLATKAKG